MLSRSFLLAFLVALFVVPAAFAVKIHKASDCGQTDIIVDSGGSKLAVTVLAAGWNNEQLKKVVYDIKVHNDTTDYTKRVRGTDRLDGDSHWERKVRANYGYGSGYAKAKVTLYFRGGYKCVLPPYDVPIDLPEPL